MNKYHTDKPPAMIRRLQPQVMTILPNQNIHKLLIILKLDRFRFF